MEITLSFLSFTKHTSIFEYISFSFKTNEIEYQQPATDAESMVMGPYFNEPPLEVVTRFETFDLFALIGEVMHLTYKSPGLF